MSNIAPLQQLGSSSGTVLGAQSVTMTLTAGSSLHVIGMVGTNTGSVLTISDGVNTYSGILDTLTNGSIHNSQWTADGVAGGSTTITITASPAADGFLGLHVIEVGNTSGSDTGKHNGLFTSPSVTTTDATLGTAVTPSAQPGLLSSHAAWMSGYGAGSNQWAHGTGFTAGANTFTFGGGGQGCTESLRYTSTAAQTALWTAANAGQQVGVLSVLFKEAASGSAITGTGALTSSHPTVLAVSSKVNHPASAITLTSPHPTLISGTSGANAVTGTGALVSPHPSLVAGVAARGSNDLAGPIAIVSPHSTIAGTGVVGKSGTGALISPHPTVLAVSSKVDHPAGAVALTSPHPTILAVSGSVNHPAGAVALTSPHPTLVSGSDGHYIITGNGSLISPHPTLIVGSSTPPRPIPTVRYAAPEAMPASLNPRASVIGGAPLSAGPDDLVVGRFAWLDTDLYLVTNQWAAGRVIGFVPAVQSSYGAMYLSGDGLLRLHAGYRVTLISSGDFWVRFPYGASVGQRVYAAIIDGAPISGQAINAVPTQWVTVTDTPPGGLAVVSTWS